MTLLTSAFGLFRHPRGMARPRRPKPLCFEPLETRQLMTTSPFHVFNNTQLDASGTRAFQDDQIYVALYAQDYAQTSAPYYYFDASGNAHLTSTAPGKVIPTFNLTALTPTDNHTYVIHLPQELGGQSYGLQSARMYFFMSDGSSNVPSLTVNSDAVGSVNAPVPGNNYFDYIEFSLNAPNNPAGNLNIDTTNVDQFGVPIRILVDSADPGNPANGVGIDTPRDQVIQQFVAFTSAPNDPFRIILDTNAGAYGPYRIQNPSGVLAGLQSAQSVIQVETILQHEISATATMLLVYSGQSFPDPNVTPFTIQVRDEQMRVTGAAAATGGVNWTVQRGANGTVATAHAQGAWVSQAAPVMTATQNTITVGSTINFPTDYPFNVRVDGEIMTVTGLFQQNLNGTTTWYVTRGVAGSTATAHNQNATVFYDSVTQNPLNSYFNAAIDQLFTKYKDGETLYVQSKADGNDRIYQGTVVQVDAQGGIVPSGGSYVLRFTSPDDPDNIAYDVYYPFLNANRYYWAGYTPALPPGDPPPHTAGANYAAYSPSEMVFACNGVFADNAFRQAQYPAAGQQKVLADLENQIVSALNRGVAQLQGINHTAPSDTSNTWADHGQYYENNQHNQPWNRYAQFLHQNSVSIDGKNYGFAFDDQNGYASDIAVANFESVRIVLESWSASAPPPPPQALSTSMRGFLASYLADYAPTDEAVALPDVADPQAAPLSIVDQVLAGPDAGLAFSGYLGQTDQDEEDDPAIVATVFSMRSLVARRLAG